MRAGQFSFFSAAGEKFRFRREPVEIENTAGQLADYSRKRCTRNTQMQRNNADIVECDIQEAGKQQKIKGMFGITCRTQRTG